MAVQVRDNRQHVVIVGGGFGGLYAAKRLAGKRVRVTIVDKNNYHLFQPLLYQIATGGLSPGDVASPLRSVFKRYPNISVIKTLVTDIDPHKQIIITDSGELAYDSLIIATGTSNFYFGHDSWKSSAPGLKTVEDALRIRGRVFSAFEEAEKETDETRRKEWLRFVIIGGGPTGVELAGALGELCGRTLKNEFRRIDPADSKVILIEGGHRVLNTFPQKLSDKAHRSLEKLGVICHPNTKVSHIEGNTVTVTSTTGEESITARTIIWAAGVRTTPLAEKISAAVGVELDRGGRLPVKPDLTIPGLENIFIIGDLARVEDENGQPLPGVAPVAMQEGRYVAETILRRLSPIAKSKPFKYSDKGNLAVIGRNAAVAQFTHLSFSGFPAWIIWLFVHIAYLIEYDNKILVLVQWAANYFTRKQGARLITDGSPTMDDSSLGSPPSQALEKSHHA